MADHQVSTHPSSDLVAVTAHDTNPIVSGRATRGIYVGSIAGGATMTVITRNGQTVAFAGLVAGTLYPIQATHIKSTGTLASSLVAFF